MTAVASAQNEQCLVVSKKGAAKALDCSVDTVDRLVARGDLERVQLSPRRVGVTWRSMLKLLERGAA